MPSRSSKLTKRSVDAAASRQGRYIVWDTDLKGFGLRVAATGTKTYIVRYRPRGHGSNAPKRFVVLGRHGPLTPDEARIRARSLLGKVAAGEDPAIERAQSEAAITVANLVVLFVCEHARAKRKSRTSNDYEAVLNKYLVPRYGRRPANQLSSIEIGQLHLALCDRPYQANRMLAIIASMFSFAAKRGLVAKGFNPCAEIERFPEKARERYLTPDEFRRLGETLRLAETSGLPWREGSRASNNKHLPPVESRRTVLSPEIVLALRLLIFTGARLREILHLEWRSVDLERGVLFLPDSKTGRKTVVLSATVIKLLRERRRESDLVIPGAAPNSPRSDLKRPWQMVQRHARLEGVRLHDLRHTFASMGVGASLGLPIVGKLLGHSQPATTARYAHLDADPLRRATDLIGTQIEKALEPIGDE